MKPPASRWHGRGAGAGALAARRRWGRVSRALAALLLVASPPTVPQEEPSTARVVPGVRLAFPQDEGSHEGFRTEWWYVTGWLDVPGGRPVGFQVTFFRSRVPQDPANDSHLAARQILFAHTALADPDTGRLSHDQRIARSGLQLAESRPGSTDVWIGDWSLQGRGGSYQTHVDAREFQLNLAMSTDTVVLLQGNAGFSAKGKDPQAASYYYSRPQLRVRGTLARGGAPVAVTGSAWFDHEWSNAYLEPGAVGWDWTGLNLSDGGALMAFRIRGAQGEPRWAGGTLRGGDGSVQTLGPGDIQFAPLRRWTSPRTGVVYPVAMALTAGSHHYVLTPLMDDQELDSRASTGTIYWEGAVTATTVPSAGSSGASVAAGTPLVPASPASMTGRGYLELTGYWQPLGF